MNINHITYFIQNYIVDILVYKISSDQTFSTCAAGQPGKTTAIRRTAVRGICAPQGIMRAQLKGPETSRNIAAFYLTEGFKWALTHLCPPLRSTFAVRETASLGQQMLSATVGINGLNGP